MKLENAEKVVQLCEHRKQLKDELNFLEKFEPYLVVKDRNGREVFVEDEPAQILIDMLRDRKNKEIQGVEQEIENL